MFALVIKLGIGSTGNRRYAREYCCSFEKSCLFFLKDVGSPLKVSHLAQEEPFLKNNLPFRIILCLSLTG